MIANTPQPPYYAVIFTSRKNEGVLGYEKIASHMEGLVKEQDGFLGLETARNELGITVSYWKNLKSIQAWKVNSEHRHAQALGKKMWYSEYKVRIAKVEKDYEF